MRGLTAPARKTDQAESAVGFGLHGILFGERTPLRPREKARQWLARVFPVGSPMLLYQFIVQYREKVRARHPIEMGAYLLVSVEMVVLVVCGRHLSAH
jgi:hypothetical protein